MSPPDWYTQGRPHVWLPYAQMKTVPAPVPVVSAAGCRIKLADGRELIDGISSWWTACHGHAHPHIVAAIARQAETLPHVMFGGLAHEPAYTLARRLARLLPGDLDHVFFTDSGSVAVEVALKMAVQFNINRGVPGRRRFVCFRHGYHGDTLGAMSVTDPDDGMHAVFAGYIPEQILAEVPRTREARANFDRLLSKHRDEIAAVIVEPLVQGAGGMKIHDAETLAAIAESAARHDVLLIADEIMTGFGRTGRMFACEEADIVPDIVCLSKALTGGTMALAATVARTRVYEGFLSDDPTKALMHGPTYMANPLACAVANASLDLFGREPRLMQVAAIEAKLKDALAPCRNVPGVADVRVKGAIGAVELSPMRDLDWLRRRFIDEGIWLRPFENVVYTTPPFVVSEAELDRLCVSIERVTVEWSRRA